MGGVQLRRRLLARGNFHSSMEISDFCLLATAYCYLTITVHECSDWLQHCFMNIYAKIILFYFRRGSMLK